MMGIEKYKSILFIFPNGIEHVICVYWIGGEEKTVVVNNGMVILNRSFNIFDLYVKESKRTIQVLTGLGK